MPAAPAGRALPQPGGRADSPCRNHATRRGFMLGAGAMLASLLLPRGVPTAAAQAAPGARAWDAGA